MTETTETTTSRLFERWPTALGLVLAAGVVPVIPGLDADEAASDFGPGAAAMMAIYLAAYAIGKPASAWLAFPGDMRGGLGHEALAWRSCKSSGAGDAKTSTWAQYRT